MPVVQRKSAPGVRNGRVLKKNNHLANPGNFYRVPQGEVHVIRERPGEGYRHVLTVRDVIDFLHLCPELQEPFEWLDAIILAPGEPGLFGRYKPRYGIITLNAWPRNLTEDYLSIEFYKENQVLLDRLGLETKLDAEGQLWANWTEEQAKAFHLLDVLPHELGHHVDRMTSRRRRECGRGEPFAETYARDLLPILWDRYWRAKRR